MSISDSRPKESPIKPGEGQISDQAYRHLRNAILRGEIEVGTVLAESEVAENLGISRTPVRQALHLLLQEGLVTIGPRRQVLVQGISPERRREIFIIREALECAAVVEACEKMAIEDIDRLRLSLIKMKRAVDNGDLEELIEIDEEFHLAIPAGAGMPTVVKFIDQMRAFVRVMGLEAVLNSERRRQNVLAEHTAIVDAIEARDAEKAAAAMAEHLRVSREALEQGAGEGDGED